MLLKYVEDIYTFDFIKKCYPNSSNKELELQRKHLEGRWCILNKEGVEKIEFDSFKNPHLLSNSCIYSMCWFKRPCKRMFILFQDMLYVYGQAHHVV